MKKNGRRRKKKEIKQTRQERNESNSHLDSVVVVAKRSGRRFPRHWREANKQTWKGQRIIFVSNKYYSIVLLKPSMDRRNGWWGWGTEWCETHFRSLEERSSATILFVIWGTTKIISSKRKWKYCSLVLKTNNPYETPKDTRPTKKAPKNKKTDGCGERKKDDNSKQTRKSHT